MLLVGVRGFGHAVAEENQRVAGLELHAGRRRSGFRNQAHRKRTLGEKLGDLAAAKKQAARDGRR